MKERIFEPNPSEDELALRPSRFEDFIGQKPLVENLKVFVQAAKNRGRALDHVLFSGPPGLGKTTLANLLSKELDSQITVTSAKVLTRGADLAKFLTLLGERDLLFIDELHSLPRGLEEILYPAMEDYSIDLVLGEGMTAQTVQIPIKPFTLVGATTRNGMISDPLRNRFGIQLRLEYYEDSEMKQIVMRSASLLQIPISEEAAAEIGKRSRKTPRIANHLLKRIRDFADLENNGVLDTGITKKALQRLGIDDLGLDNTDREILDCMIQRYKGGPVGLKSIAVLIGEEERTIEDTYEPFLVRSGLINRTPAGRVVTPFAYQHLGIHEPSRERQLFT